MEKLLGKIIITGLLATLLAGGACSAPQKKKGPAPQKTAQKDPFLSDEEYFDGKKSGPAGPAEDPYMDDVGPSTEAKGFLAANPGNTQTGYASWYGKKYHGKPTASGELYDIMQLTAAHRDLPFGSVVMVKNLDNGKTTQVRINDRGPFVDGRIIDVSYKGAKQLGILQKGYCKAKITVIKAGDVNAAPVATAPAPAPTNENWAASEPVATEELEEEEVIYEDPPAMTPAAAPGPKGYTIQVGAFKQSKLAYKLKDKLLADYGKKVFITKQGSFRLVWVGDFPSKAAAQDFRQTLISDGFAEAFIYKSSFSGT